MWVSVPIENAPAEHAVYSGRVINLDNVEEISLSARGNECLICYVDGSEEHITGITAIPFYNDCLKAIFNE